MADLLDLVDERVNNVYPRYELKVFLAKAVGGRVRQGVSRPNRNVSVFSKLEMSVRQDGWGRAAGGRGAPA